MSSAAENSPFVKQLAANDRKTRDKAVESLRTFLSSRRQLDELELLKLWKGLFYCMWMSDKPRVQHQLAVDLGTLVDVLPEESVIPFLDAFWKTMAREWNGIDVLRMDKFLSLVRQYLAASFRKLAQQTWKNVKMIEDCMRVLEETPLNPTNNKLPNGMRYHVIDIYVDEMDKVDADRNGDMPVQTLLLPLKHLKEKSPTKSIRDRVQEALNDERLRDWQGTQIDGKSHLREEEDKNGHETRSVGEDGEEEEWDGLDDWVRWI